MLLHPKAESLDFLERSSREGMPDPKLSLSAYVLAVRNLVWHSTRNTIKLLTRILETAFVNPSKMSLVLRVSKLGRIWSRSACFQRIWHTASKLPTTRPCRRSSCQKEGEVSREEHMKFERAPKTRWIFYEIFPRPRSGGNYRSRPDHPALLHGLFCT